MDRKLINMKTVLRSKYGKIADSMHLYRYEDYTVYKVVSKTLYESRRIENIESPYHGEATANNPRYTFDQELDPMDIDGVKTFGEGVFYTGVASSEHKVVCPTCKGLGHVFDKTCTRCEGMRMLFRKRVLEQRFYYETQNLVVMPLALLKKIPERYIKNLPFDTKDAKHVHYETDVRLDNIKESIPYDISYLKFDLEAFISNIKQGNETVQSIELIYFPTHVQYVQLIDKYLTKEVFFHNFKNVIWFPDL